MKRYVYIYLYDIFLLCDILLIVDIRHIRHIHIRHILVIRHTLLWYNKSARVLAEIQTNILIQKQEQIRAIHFTTSSLVYVYDHQIYKYIYIYIHIYIYIFKEQTKKIQFIQSLKFHVTNLQLSKLHIKTLRNQVSVMVS